MIQCNNLTFAIKTSLELWEESKRLSLIGKYKTLCSLEKKKSARKLAFLTFQVIIIWLAIDPQVVVVYSLAWSRIELSTI